MYVVKRIEYITFRFFSLKRKFRFKLKRITLFNLKILVKSVEFRFMCLLLQRLTICRFYIKPAVAFTIDTGQIAVYCLLTSTTPVCIS